MRRLSFAQQVALRRRLRGDAGRFLAAHARGSDAGHTSWMGLLVSLSVRDALAAGWPLAEVTAAVGLTDPPARLGLDDAELAMSRRWTA